MKVFVIVLVSVVALAVVGWIGLHVLGIAGVYVWNHAINHQTTPGQDSRTVATSAKRAPTSANPNGATYTVKKGDTPAKIARAHGVSPEELSKLNKLDDPNKIQLAQVLQLPKKDPHPL